MHSHGKKLGLLTLIAIVVGSQIGSGALSAPSVFAKYGLYSLYSWLFAGLGAMSLAYVFSKLSSLFPFTGGPHVYIKAAFNDRMAFFTGWIYWMVSWISTVVVLIACMAYLAKALQLGNMFSVTLLGLIIWFGVNWINCRSIVLSGKVEFVLTIVKVLFFLTFILIPLHFFDYANIKTYNVDFDFISSISAALWGFIGLEVATTPAESVEEPSVNIPKAVMFGTLLVVIIYMLANLAAIGSVNYAQLESTAAPYDIISQKVFRSSFLTNFLAFVLCLGSLNAWVLAAGQIALGLSNDKMLPKAFGKLKHNVPYFSIWLSAIGVGVIWIFCALFGYANQISIVIDALTPAFILVYLLCSLAFIKYARGFIQYLIGLLSVLFCGFLLCFTSLFSVYLILFLIIMGTIVYIMNVRKIY